ncbi:MAG: Lipopolysaccharide core heptosyltransferase RfaQ [Candidatus Celerinatantimonas neptuna]|nr:MAG: Lipopolysaccharide core heptosyltransferase RfaQ [Candidatus Celerinatantimonas neptuna]
MQPSFSTISSICIVRLSAIGDVCNASTIISRIRQTWPDASITWICGAAEFQLLQLIPDLNLICFDKKAGFKAYRKVWKALNKQRFDVLLHLQASFRASILTTRLHARRRIGYHRSRAYELQWLFTNEQTIQPHGLHVVDNYQAFADTLGCKSAPVSWPFILPDSAKASALKLVSELGKPFIAICPAASKGYKNWYVDGYIKVIQAIQYSQYPVILVGSPAKIERQLASAIEAGLNTPAVNLVGETSLPELMAILQQAELLITPDTGPAHMAAAMHTPVVGLYAHHNPLRVGPYGYVELAVSHWDKLIRQQTGKSPEQLPWRCRVKDDHAMQSIQPEEVLAQIAKVLKLKAL